MPLSREERDRIVEEETLRFQTRAKAHEICNKDRGACSHCGHKSGCRGCRIWALIFGVIMFLFVFRILDWHGDRCAYFGDNSRTASGQWAPQTGGAASQGLPNPATKNN